MAGKDATDSISMISNVKWLRIYLKETFMSILPDLLLDIDDISYIQHNNT